MLLKEDSSGYELEDATANAAEAIKESSRRVRVKVPSKYLCFRCANAMIYKREGAADPIIFCSSFDRRMPLDIVECNKFRPEGTLDVWDMAKLAKIIDINEKKSVGFKKGVQI